MSGQEISLTLARVASLTIAGHRVENAQVAVFESETMMPPALGIDGIAGLSFFRDQPITFDHPAMRVTLESTESLARREATGTKVSVRVKHDGPSTEVYLPLELAPGVVAQMEVDSRSSTLILDDRFMEPMAIDPSSPALTRKEGRDETGNLYLRRYATLSRALHVASASKLEVPTGSPVMFQKIIHDGLIGQEFLREHVVVFDLAHAAMIFDP